jgi:hypothetical protein
VNICHKKIWLKYIGLCVWSLLQQWIASVMEAIPCMNKTMLVAEILLVHFGIYSTLLCCYSCYHCHHHLHSAAINMTTTPATALTLCTTTDTTTIATVTTVIPPHIYIVFIWVVIHCCLVGGYRCFGWNVCLYFQGLLCSSKILTFAYKITTCYNQWKYNFNLFYYLLLWYCMVIGA